jgi:hypothetical protein
MGQVDGLIIPRSYNDYFSRSDPQAIRDIVAEYTDDAVSTTSELPVQNKVITAYAQPKTLATPVHLEGQDYTTVETALAALAGAGGNSSVNRYATLAAAEAALAIPEGSAGYLGDNAIVIVDELSPYVEGENRTVTPAQNEPEEETPSEENEEETPAEEEPAEESEEPAENEEAEE